MFVKKRPSPETAEVLGTRVLFLTQDYYQPDTFIMYGDPVKEFDTDMNFVTIASAEAKDVKIEDYEFKETTHVFIDFTMHRLIEFDLQPMKLSEAVFNISKIYMEIFKAFGAQAEVCCDGHEYLYLKKLKVHPDNVISLVIDQKIPKSSGRGAFGKLIGRLNIFGKKSKSADGKTKQAVSKLKMKNIKFR